MNANPKIARISAGLTQAALAEILGISRWVYMTLEKNPKNFTIDLAERFSVAVKMPVDEIFFSGDSISNRT